MTNISLVFFKEFGKAFPPNLAPSSVISPQLNLNDLTAVPFVTGNFFCVVRVNEGTSFHGKSEGSEVSAGVFLRYRSNIITNGTGTIRLSISGQVKRHTINWNKSYNFTCKLYSGINDAVLDPCPCRISIIQASYLLILARVC